MKKTNEDEAEVYTLVGDILIPGRGRRTHKEETLLWEDLRRRRLIYNPDPNKPTQREPFFISDRGKIRGYDRITAYDGSHYTSKDKSEEVKFVGSIAINQDGWFDRTHSIRIIV